MNYYHPEGDGYVTEIQNADFFLSPHGAVSPEGEFEAFVQAMRAARTDKNQQEALCRYPARTTLLIDQLPEFKTYTRPDCSHYPRYIDPQKVTGVSLVFASGYFESPSSYFGHTMLKFETDRKDFSEYFFDSSLNYGAKVTDAPGNPMYIVNGLTGRYKASFQRNNDFINTYSYTNKDMRDIWEYPLRLTPRQRTFMVEYSSELRRAQFKYYFFSDNCAHRMARLIELTTGQKLVKTDGAWLLPIDVVQALHSPQHGESPFADEVRTPSLKSQVRGHYLKLSPRDRRMVDAFLVAPVKDQTSSIAELSDSALDVIRMHYDVELAKLSAKPRDLDKLQDLQPHRQLALYEQLKRPVVQASEIQPEKRGGVTPATMNHASAVQIGYIARSGDDALNFRFQAANNDLLTKPFEGQEASRFIFGAGEVDVTQNDLKLRSLTLLDIMSLNTNPLPAKATGEYSWALKAAYEPRNLICEACSTLNMDAKAGKAWRVSEGWLLYSLIGGQVNNKQTQMNDILMVTSENGALINLGESTRLNVEANIEVSPLEGNPGYLFRGAVARDLTTQSDIRFSLENDGSHSAALVRLGFYLN